MIRRDAWRGAKTTLLPQSCRWITRDPIGLDGGENAYEFCSGNPLMLADPSGLEPLDDLGNFFGAWGGALTFGGTGALAQAINRSLGNGEFQYGGAYFDAGTAVGTVHSIALSAGGAIRLFPSAKGTFTIYRSLSAGQDVQYVGLTMNFGRRAIEHSGSFDVQVIKGLERLTKYQARNVEQALIDFHKLGRNGGTLLNKINSISKSSPNYASRLKDGYDLLRKVHYAGIH